MKILNPYNYKGEFYKGNLHTHSNTSPCGHYPMDQIIFMYSSFKMEYDFLAITDHYKINNIERFKERQDILILNGIEFKKSKKQTLGINIFENNDNEEEYTNHNKLFEDVNNQGGFNIICHPHFGHDDYWTKEELLNLENYLGIEIFNNNVRMDSRGRAIATDLWDEILSKGKHIYGFANDDMHVFSRVGGGYNMVLAEEKTKDSIINAIKRGSFYASSGVKIRNIKLLDNIISVEKADDRVDYIFFKFIGKNGQVLKECKGEKASYNVKGNEGYVRVEAYREDGCRAWTQPFFIEN